MKSIEQKKLIAASLWFTPATLDELYERDFCKNWSHFGIDTYIQIMYQDEWIYERHGKWHTYKKFAMSSEMSEYEL